MLSKSRTGRALVVLLVLIALAAALGQGAAQAAAAYKAKAACKLYSKISKNAKTRKVSKGHAVTVYAVKGKWCKVSVNGVKGYMLKSSLTKGAQIKSKAKGYSTLRPGSSGTAVKRVQAQLAKRGFLSSSGVTGRYSSSTAKAVRRYQMMAGLSVSGSATSATQKKLFSSNSKRPKVTLTRWSNYEVSKYFPDGATATIVDLNTGARLRIRRVGGHNHLDVEPAYASDTAVLKRMYGGSWSWDSRGVLFIVGGRYIAAAINGMPHGAEISKSNNFDGQFCLHLYGSTTHGSGDSNSAHQSNIRRVYNYFN